MTGFQKSKSNAHKLLDNVMPMLSTNYCWFISWLICDLQATFISVIDNKGLQARKNLAEFGFQHIQTE